VSSILLELGRRSHFTVVMISDGSCIARCHAAPNISIHQGTVSLWFTATCVVAGLRHVSDQTMHVTVLPPFSATLR
jgi:hypothetical protein